MNFDSALEKIKDKSPVLKIASAVLGIVFILVFSYARAKKETIGGDFHVLWQAGVDLWNRLPIDHQRPGMREFIYPPFSALFFSIYSIFPFKVATYLFFLTNFSLWGFSFVLLKKIFESFKDISPNKITTALLLTFFLSFKFYWNNIMMVQCNLIVYIFCLLGTLSYLRKNENKAILYFAIGTSIKLTPVFFFFWVVFKGNIKTFLKCVLSGLICILLPMIVAGFSRGPTDLAWYAENFVLKFLTVSQVSYSYANQALSSTIFSIFTDLHEPGSPAYTLINLGPDTAGIIYKTFFWCFLGLIFYIIFRSRGKDVLNDKQIPSLLILAMLLLSGIAWKAHLTSLSIVYAYWFLITKSNNKFFDLSWKVITGLIVISSLAGKEIIGQSLQRQVGGYGLYTWVMVLIFIYLAAQKIFEIHSIKSIENSQLT